MTVQHLINVSSGKDSTACYLLALERGVPFRAVFADTMNEHEAVYEYLDRLPERTGGPKIERVRADFTKEIANKRLFIAHDQRIGRRYKLDDKKRKIGGGRRIRWSNRAKRRALSVLYPTGNVYLDLCLWKGRFPSRKAQFCTEELKTLPIIEKIVLPALRNGPVLQWLGIRADESQNRAKQPRFNRTDSGAYLWRPIFTWTAQQTFDLHVKHGIARNPLYDRGFTRVGCMPCINCKKDELRLISEQEPAHIARIAEWERLVGMAGKRGAATFFAGSNHKVQGESIGDRHPHEIVKLANVNQAVRWAKTARGGKNFALFFEEQAGGGCNSDLAVCET